MDYLCFDAPPLPHYFICGEQLVKEGSNHASRSNIGVFDLLIVTKGTLYIGELDHQWELKAWDMCILRPDANHYSIRPCQEDTHFYWIHFQADRWRQLQNPFFEKSPFLDINQYHHFGNAYSLLIPKHWSITNTDDVARETRLLLSLNNKTSMANCWEQQAAFHRLLRIIAQETYETRSSSNQLLTEKVTEYLRNHYREAISSEMLTEKFHFHSVYITRTMQRYLGCTPLQYLQKIRIDQAKLLLVNTDKSIAAISEEVGFDSNTYFTRCFQKIERRTPREYRKQFRK